MNVKKTMAFMMSAVLFISAFTGCGGNGGGSNGGNGGSDDGDYTIQNEGMQIALFGEESANFMLVRSADASQEVKVAAKELKDKIGELGVEVEYKPDTVAYKADVCEVNIGVTNRAHAQSIYEELVGANANNAFDYMIQYKENVIYIVGVTDEALVKAMEYFGGKFCESKSATIGDAYSCHYHFGEGSGFAIVGDKDLSGYRIVTPRYNMSYLIGREIPNLQEAIKKHTASVVSELMDNEAETECEIIVGNTKRAGAPEITDEDEYRITLSGKKLYVTGGSDKATAIAVKELIRMIEEGTAIEEKADIKGSYAETLKNYENYYSLTWADEFGGDVLDTKIWGAKDGPFTHFMSDNPLRMVCDEKSLYVKDGKLHMRASQDEVYYNSVEIRSAGLKYKYGLLECSSTFNAMHGMCAAFWLVSSAKPTYSAELDIFESEGAPNNQVKATPISRAYNGEEPRLQTDYCGLQGDPWEYAVYTLDEGDSFADGYHTFGCEWDETRITFTVDGRELVTVDTTAHERAKDTYNDFMNLIFTMYGSDGEGSSQADNPDKTTDWENNCFVTEYVRLYQLPEQELIVY